VPPTREPGPSPLRSRAFVALLAATFCAFCGYTLLLAVAPLWAMTGGAAQVGAGATTAVFMLATVLAQLGSPALLRRAAHGPVLAAGAAVLGLSAVLHLLSNDLTLVVVTSAARGVGFGIVTGSGSALVAELLPVGHHGRGAGLYGIAVGVPNVLGLAGGVWLVERGGFAPIFWMAGALPLAGALFAATIPGAVRTGARRPAATAPGSWLVGQQVAGTAVMITTAFAAGAVVTFLPDALGLAVPALLTFSVASTVGRWGAGALNDRHGRPRVLVPAVVAAVAGMLCLAMAVGPAAGRPVAVLALGGALLLGAGTPTPRVVTSCRARARTLSMRLCWKPPWPMHTVGRPGVGSAAGSQWRPGTVPSPVWRSKRRSVTACSVVSATVSMVGALTTRSRRPTRRRPG
jgi:MFS family permease